MYKKILSLLILGVVYCGAFSQSGAIRGTVYDGETGETMIGANVYISGTTTGKMTDLDGKYSLEGLAAGTYTVKSSFIGFDEVSQDVTLAEGEIFILDITLGEAPIEIDVVQIEAKASTNNEQAVLTRQKKSAVVLDGISASQISKSGDSDAAGALKRVTGISVEGGKYVYVRGLGDRYSKTLVNGAQVPGLDPNRNTVQMDLFPTQLVDNIVVYKTFSADLPGDFTGGLVDISTKDFPERFTLQFGAQIGANTNATMNKNFLGFKGGSTDWLAIGVKNRAVPDFPRPIPTDGQAVADPAAGTQLYETTRSFERDWVFTNNRPPLNHRIGFAIGNQKKLFGKPIGYVFGLTYKREWNYYQGGQTNRYTLPSVGASALTRELILSDEQGSDMVLWGALFNTSYKISNNSKIAINLMHNRTMEKTARYQSGFKPADDVDLRYETNTWWYEERSLSTAQLKGEHVMGKTEFIWFSNFAVSIMDQPDLHFFTSGYRVFGDDTIHTIEPSIGQVPSRYWRDMTEYNVDNSLKFTTPFKLKNGGKGNVKYGAGYLYKDRDFGEEQYRFNNNTRAYDGIPNDYFADTNLLGYTVPIDPADRNGVFVNQFPSAANNYVATQHVAAGYISTELPLKENLKLILGARYEFTKIDLINGQDTTANLQNNDILPSVTLNYGLNEKTNLRFAYTRTLARPTFRELAPFASFSFIGDFILVGNPDLVRTTIDNVDFRYEVFPNFGEIFSVGAFYKHFTNPIERTFNITSVNPELTYRNVDKADLVGAEIEIRKNFSFLSDKPAAENFAFGFNASYIYTRVDIDSAEFVAIQALNPDAKPVRSMFGQSPFLINFLLTYQNKKGTSANLSFNVQGRQISVIGFKGNPNIFQNPIPLLNFTLDQELKKGWSIRFTATNILNSIDKQIQPYNNINYVYQANRNGVELNFGVKYVIK